MLGVPGGAALRVEVVDEVGLRFDDGSPVRAASAIVGFGGGWLVAQDDATSAAWHTASATRRLRLLPPVQGHDSFSSAEGTKHLKPDLEAACPVVVAGRAGALLLGSGSTPARERAVLVLEGSPPEVVSRELGPLYARVGAALSLAPGQLNLEGACPVGHRLRWFQRGDRHAGVASASVEVDLAALLAATATGTGVEQLQVHEPQRYDLGSVHGVALAVTDALALADGRVLVSAAAEDTPNPVDDGPVLGVALALLDGPRTVSLADLPGPPHKVEGLALAGGDGQRLDVVAVVDADDAQAASLLLRLAVEL